MPSVPRVSRGRGEECSSGQGSNGTWQTAAPPCDYRFAITAMPLRKMQKSQIQTEIGTRILRGDACWKDLELVAV